MNFKNIFISALIGFVISALGFVFLYVFGQAVTLACERTETGRISCVKTSVLLSVLKVDQKPVESLEMAWVSESCDEDGCTYRVELDTARGTIPMTIYRSSGYRSKENMANQINAFLRSPDQPKLEVKASTGIIGILMPVIAIVAGPLVTISRIRKAAV